MKFPINPPMFPIETQIVTSCSVKIKLKELFALCNSSKLIVIQNEHKPNANANILPKFQLLELKNWIKFDIIILHQKTYMTKLLEIVLLRAKFYTFSRFQESSFSTIITDISIS